MLLSAIRSAEFGGHSVGGMKSGVCRTRKWWCRMLFGAFAFNTECGEWRKLGDMGNDCISHDLASLSSFFKKGVTIGRNLTNLWPKNNFWDTVYTVFQYKCPRSLLLCSLTDFYQIWYTVYYDNLQHNCYWFAHLAYIMLLRYLGKFTFCDDNSLTHYHYSNHNVYHFTKSLFYCSIIPACIQNSLLFNFNHTGLKCRISF